ncbi:MAG: response regulator transcription factor [Salinibacterium sp.]|nr:response regulator transcription factor [Salinibacterium sp.]
MDDHRLFRAGTNLLLSRDHRLKIVGEASSSQGALRLATLMRPDVLILDVELGGDSAPVTIRRIKHEVPSTEIVVLTMHRDLRLREHLTAHGAADCLTKDADGSDLVRAVLTAAGRASSSQAEGVNPRTARLLTERQIEVLRLLARGCSNREIAHQLVITEGTVKRHVSDVFAKLDVNSRINAARKAGRLGLLGGREGYES